MHIKIYRDTTHCPVYYTLYRTHVYNIRTSVFMYIYVHIIHRECTIICVLHTHNKKHLTMGWITHSLTTFFLLCYILRIQSFALLFRFNDLSFVFIITLFTIVFSIMPFIIFCTYSTSSQWFFFCFVLFYYLYRECWEMSFCKTKFLRNVQIRWLSTKVDDSTKVVNEFLF